MPDTKISALPAATLPLAGTEDAPIVQDGETRRAPSSAFSAGRLLAANNLSDLASAATARDNLGVPSDAEVAGLAQAAIHAAPTTISGTSHTAVLGNAYAYLRFTNAAAVTFTIPPEASVNFGIGTVIAFEQAGAGVVTLTPGAGVTINSRGGALGTAGQFAVGQIKKVGADVWTAIGDVA
jgi:hypothetical protein